MASLVLTSSTDIPAKHSIFLIATSWGQDHVPGIGYVLCCDAVDNAVGTPGFHLEPDPLLGGGLLQALGRKGGVHYAGGTGGDGEYLASPSDSIVANGSVGQRNSSSSLLTGFLSRLTTKAVVNAPSRVPRISLACLPPPAARSSHPRGHG